MGVGKTLINGITLPAIFLRYPPGEPISIFLDDPWAIIRRAAINNDIFQIRIILSQHRLDRFLDKLGLVIGGGYD